MPDAERFHPMFKHRVDLILSDLQRLGWQPVVASGVRTRAEQVEKVEHGYSRTVDSWHVLGTSQIISAGPTAIQEVHGAAADIVDRRYGWSAPAGNKDFLYWKDLGRIAKKHGCEWGGDWKMRDVAHVQMRIVETAPVRTMAV
jgi:peptidoglycan L-alanyl-D-glutamate endopeptidase CwlK